MLSKYDERNTNKNIIDTVSSKTDKFWCTFSYIKEDLYLILLIVYEFRLRYAQGY